MSGLAVGVQVRDRRVEAAVVAPSGAVAKRLSLLTSASDLNVIERGVAGLVNRLRSEFDVGAVGVVARPRLLSSRLQARVDLPVIVESEANATCWGEFRFGAGQGVANMVGISLGPVVEGAVIADSALLHGAGDNAGNFAHLHLVEGGHPCGCGLRGCWDRYVSSTALAEAARSEARRDPGRSRRLLVLADGDPDRVVSQHVARAAARDDLLALELFEKLGAALGTAMATLTVMLDPEAIVIGGELVSSAQFYLPTSKAVLAAALPPVFTPPALLVAQRRDDAAIIGVADLSRQQRGRAVPGRGASPRSPASVS